jgi:hypothetical protein
MRNIDAMLQMVYVELTRKRKEQQTIDDLENLLDIFEKNKIR